MSEQDPYGVSRGMNYWPNGVSVQMKEWSRPYLSWSCHICGIGAWEDYYEPDPNWKLLGGLEGARKHNCQ